MTTSKLVTLATVGKTHGIKGWLKVHSFTDPVSNLADYQRFHVSGADSREGVPATLQMDQVQLQGDHLIAHFIGFDDPETARPLVGLELQVTADRLPELTADEYYWHQLIGLRVSNLDGQLLGSVKRMLETGANDVLVVHPCDGSLDEHERLIPYLPGSVIKRVDLDNGELQVDWGADFLL